MPRSLPVTGSAPRFRELDGLRGIAALAVVIGHLTATYDDVVPGQPAPFFRFEYGAFGVQLFFMISGFVILMSGRRATRPTDFAISRASRLYPTYWMALALSSALLATTWLGGVYPVTARMVLLNLTMVQRWFLVDGVDGVYWTLAIEMQFYVAVFLLLVLTRCRLTTRLVAGAALAWTVVSVLVALLARPHSQGIVPTLVATPWKILLNVTLAEYGPLFATGCLAFMGRRGELPHWWACATGVAAVVVSVLLHSPTYGIPVFVVVSTFLLVARLPATPPLLWRPVQWLGKVSYSLYVFHYLLGFAVTRALEPTTGRDGAMALALVLVLVVAAALNRVGEQWASAHARQALLHLRGHRVRAARA